MGRGTRGASRGIAAATSAAAPQQASTQGRMSAATQQHLQQAQAAIVHEVNDLTPAADGSWVGIANNHQQARVRRTADGYEVQMFTPGSDTPQTGFFDGTKAGLRKARRAIRGHLGV